MHNATDTATGIAGRPPDRAACLGGLFLLLTAAATAVAVFARVAADADQDTLLESLLVVDENRAMYGVSGLARSVSGAALLAAGVFLWKTWVIRERFATPWVPYLFAWSGICTAVSGAMVLVVTAYPEPAAVMAGGAATGNIAEVVEVAWDLRWITAKVGFAVAGAALMLAARYQWQVGGALRRIAPLPALAARLRISWRDLDTGGGQTATIIVAGCSH